MGVTDAMLVVDYDIRRVKHSALGASDGINTVYREPIFAWASNVSLIHCQSPGGQGESTSRTEPGRHFFTESQVV